MTTSHGISPRTLKTSKNTTSRGRTKTTTSQPWLIPMFRSPFQLLELVSPGRSPPRKRPCLRLNHTKLSSSAFTSGALPEGWELGLINCIPKSAGAAAITRLHPLALQNVKKKWVVNILCIQVEQNFQQLTHRKQVGCIKGRQMMHHIWGLRSQYESMSRGALVTFDFSNAFPTLTHQFISAVLQLIHLPAHT